MAATHGERTFKSVFSKILLSDYFILYLIGLIIIVVGPFVPRFFSINNLRNIIEFIWPLFIVVIGQTFVLVVAGIDLSQPSIMAVSSVIGGFIMSNALEPAKFSKSILWGSIASESGGLLSGSSMAVPVAIIAMLLVGLFIGFLNGMSVSRLGMPPFMVTLVMQMLFSAVAIYLAQSNNIIGLPDSFNFIGEGKFGFISVAFLIALIFAAAAYLLLEKTLIGRRLFATGANTNCALISGVPTKRTILFAYMVSGFCAALAAVIYCGRLQAARPTLGNNMLMDIVGAAIIGGNSLFGGKGKIQWALFGVMFLIIISNLTNLMNVNVILVVVIKGAVILLAAFLDVTRSKILVTAKAQIRKTSAQEKVSP